MLNILQEQGDCSDRGTEFMGDEREKYTLEVIQFFQVCKLFLEGFLCKGLLDNGLQLQQIERFVEKIIGALFESSENNLLFNETGHDYDNRSGINILDLPQEFESCPARHHYVSQDQVYGFLLIDIQGILTGAGRKHIIFMEGLRREFPDDNLIIHNQ